jgi:hypothetical protein
MILVNFIFTLFYVAAEKAGLGSKLMEDTLNGMSFFSVCLLIVLMLTSTRIEEVTFTTLKSSIKSNEVH